MRLNPDQIEAIKQEAEHFFGSGAQVWLFGSRVDDHQHPQGGALQATCIQPKAGQDRLRRWVPPSGARTSARPSCLRQDRPKGERLAVPPLRGYAATLSQHGFSLVELIMVMVIVGILGAVVAPRFFDANVFKSKGFADQVQASLRYAQKEAIAQRRNVCVAFTLPAPSTLTLTFASLSGAASACDTNLAFPAGGNFITAPAGIAFDTTAPAVAPVNFNFDALGRPNPNASQTISIVGATNSITVEAETGYVH